MSTFTDELNHLLDMIETDVGEAWQQLRSQAGRVRAALANEGEPFVPQSPDLAPVAPEPVPDLPA